MENYSLIKATCYPLEIPIKVSSSPFVRNQTSSLMEIQIDPGTNYDTFPE